MAGNSTKQIRNALDKLQHALDRRFEPMGYTADAEVSFIESRRTYVIAAAVRADWLDDAVRVSPAAVAESRFASAVEGVLHSYVQQAVEQVSQADPNWKIRERLGYLDPDVVALNTRIYGISLDRLSRASLLRVIGHLGKQGDAVIDDLLET